MASEEIEVENAALLTPAEITQNSTRGNKSCWVVELEEELIEEVKTSGRNTSPVIFRVAKALLVADQQFYIPSCISVGPYHFEMAKLSSMEPHKTEAVRRMQQRIHRRRMQQEIPGRSMRSIVETEIVAMDKTIREFYDKELSYSAIDLAWMVTKDSCFLFEFMLNYLRTYPGKQDFQNDCMVEGRYDGVLSLSLMNPTWKTITSDLALFENQVPLSVLQRLLAFANSITDAEDILGDILNSVCKLRTHMVFGWGMARPYDKEKTLHFIEVSYYRHVGWDLECYGQKAYSVKNRRLLHISWTKSIFTSTGSWIWPPSNTAFEDHDGVPLHKAKLPTAAELNKKGVNFCAVTDRNIAGVENPMAIRWVRFDKETSTLYLPEVRMDHFRHALLRNFIALENTSGKYRPAPITSFAFFMDELVDSEEDVAVLREANIIINFFGSNTEAAECFNALTRSYHVSAGCKPIEDAIKGLHKYLRKKYKILWNEFISTYFAKPWFVIGSVVATILLLTAVLQVFCLFYTCNGSK